MKTIVLLAALGVIVAFGVNTARTNSAANLARANASDPKRPERLLFGGTVSDHRDGGLIVHCTEFMRALPGGYALSDIQGDFLLIGYPGDNNIADNTFVRFEAQHGGLYTFRTILGGSRTIRKIYYCDPATTPVPKKESWMWNGYNNPLNKKAR